MPNATLTVNGIATTESSHTIYAHRHNADGQEVQIEVIVYREQPPGSVNYYDRNPSIEHIVLYGGLPDAYSAISAWQVAIGGTHGLQWGTQPLAPNRFPVLEYRSCSRAQDQWNPIRFGSILQRRNPRADTSSEVELT